MDVVLWAYLFLNSLAGMQFQLLILNVGWVLVKRLHFVVRLSGIARQRLTFLCFAKEEEAKEGGRRGATAEYTLPREAE